MSYITDTHKLMNGNGKEKKDFPAQVMLTQTERDQVDRAAKLERVSRSQFMGKASLDEARRIIAEAEAEHAA